MGEIKQHLSKLAPGIRRHQKTQGDSLRNAPIGAAAMVVLRWIRNAFLALVGVGASLPSGAVGQCYGGCEPSTRHPVRWCSVFTGSPPTMVRPPSDGLQSEAQLYCAAFNAQPSWWGEKGSFDTCGPVLDLPINGTGGSTFTAQMGGRRVWRSIYTGQVTLTQDGPWNFATCGCSRDNTDGDSISGTDNKCYCRPGTSSSKRSTGAFHTATAITKNP
jgi:hypothetical protein